MPKVSPEQRSARRLSAHDLAFVAIFAAFVAVLGLAPPITLPFIAVPITAQSLGVMLAGALLGGRRAFWALLLFVGLVALGLPLLSGGRGGLGVFAGPSAGFVIGFPFAAYAVGWFTQRFFPTGRFRFGLGVAACLLGGVGILYLFGAAVFVLVTGASPLPVLVFIPGDIVKALLAASIASGVHRAYPGLLTGR